MGALIAIIIIGGFVYALLQWWAGVRPWDTNKDLLWMKDYMDSFEDKDKKE